VTPKTPAFAPGVSLHASLRQIEVRPPQVGFIEEARRTGYRAAYRDPTRRQRCKNVNCRKDGRARSERDGGHLQRGHGSIRVAAALPAHGPTSSLPSPGASPTTQETYRSRPKKVTSCPGRVVSAGRLPEDESRSGLTRRGGAASTPARCNATTVPAESVQWRGEAAHQSQYRDRGQLRGYSRGRAVL